MSGNCAGDTDVRLDPFPFSCLDPAGQATANPFGNLVDFRNQILSVPAGPPGADSNNAAYNEVIAAAGCPAPPPNAP